MPRRPNGAPRYCWCCCTAVLPEPSVVKQRFQWQVQIPRLARSLGMTATVVAMYPVIPTQSRDLHLSSLDSLRSLGMQRETPHLALGAGGASSYRSVPGARETLGRSLRPPGSCTTSICIERSIARHARPVRLQFLSHRLPNPLHAPLATRMALRSVESDRDGVRTDPVRAEGRAPARGEPAYAGNPWAVESGEGALHHVIGRTLESGEGVTVASRNRMSSGKRKSRRR